MGNKQGGRSRARGSLPRYRDAVTAPAFSVYRQADKSVRERIDAALTEAGPIIEQGQKNRGEAMPALRSNVDKSRQVEALGFLSFGRRGVAVDFVTQQGVLDMTSKGHGRNSDEDQLWHAHNVALDSSAFEPQSATLGDTRWITVPGGGQRLIAPVVDRSRLDEWNDVHDAGRIAGYDWLTRVEHKPAVEVMHINAASCVTSGLKDAIADTVQAALDSEPIQLDPVVLMVGKHLADLGAGSPSFILDGHHDYSA